MPTFCVFLYIKLPRPSSLINIFLYVDEFVTGLNSNSCANRAATDVGLAGILPEPKNSAVPLEPAARTTQADLT